MSKSKSIESIDVKVESKMSLATEAYTKIYKTKDITRKDIIETFIKDCGLTPAGAATYYTIIKKKLSKKILNQ